MSRLINTALNLMMQEQEMAKRTRTAVARH